MTALVCASVLPAFAQPHHGKDKTPATAPADKDKDADKGATATEGKKKSPKEKTFDFNALDLNGRTRTPQLLYFLERANEELERASLEKRSFIPHMVRSVEEEAM
ncbi:MAG TPA: hypothetical protein VGF94_05695 [Kofleriaceae bacterium]